MPNSSSAFAILQTIYWLYNYLARSWASVKYWIHFHARAVCTILLISVSQISQNLNTAWQSALRWILSE